VIAAVRGATYRLQLRPGFGFDDAGRLAPYLARLGVEVAYLSPVAEAVPGSAHGYDGTDPASLREELGGRAGFERLVAALRRAGLGVLLDIVPNHLATWPGGPWWRSVLREGRESPFAPVFDIAWDDAGGRVVLPLLAAPLGDVLGGGAGPQLEVRAASGAHPGGEPALCYGELELPLAEGTGEVGDDPVRVLERQHYRLACWRDQRARNYRRFFDIDGLVGVRVEDPAVFERTHALYAELLEGGAVDGLRVDHVDGLADPEEYLGRLVELAGGRPVVVEKILGRGEQLPSSWPVAGTTGYEAIDDVSAALVDGAGLRRLVEQARSEGDGEVEAVVAASKRLVAGTAFDAELERAAGLLELEPAVVAEAAVALPVYRTYGSPRSMPEESRAVLAALPLPPGALGRLADTSGHLEGVIRFQQATGPVAAKGVEDTAWYRLVGPLPFLEVGGEPAEATDGSLDRVCERASSRAHRRPGGLNPGTTHDTKRSEDVRSRLLALAELPEAVAAGLARLEPLLPPAVVEGVGVPSPLERRYLALTCLAAAPLDEAGWRDFPDRIEAVVTKAAREAKLRTSWPDPSPGYERALRDAARRLVEDGGALLRRAFGRLVDDVALYGATLSLGSVVLRSVLPGVPDCYQGDETWNLSLVDPDNRRPVDFGDLAALLERVDSLGDEPSPEALRELREHWHDGAVKLHVVRGCLAARRRAPAAFGPGARLVALRAAGDEAPSAGGVARIGPESVAVAVVTRLASRLRPGEGAATALPAGSEVWGDTSLALPPAVCGALPRRVLVDVLTGRRHQVTGTGGPAALAASEVLAELPVALLIDQR